MFTKNGIVNKFRNLNRNSLIAIGNLAMNCGTAFNLGNINQMELNIYMGGITILRVEYYERNGGANAQHIEGLIEDIIKLYTLGVYTGPVCNHLVVRLNILRF